MKGWIYSKLANYTCSLFTWTNNYFDNPDGKYVYDCSEIHSITPETPQDDCGGFKLLQYRIRSTEDKSVKIFSVQMIWLAIKYNIYLVYS